MSRIGKKPILIPSGVEIRIEGQTLTVKGPKGTLEATLHADVSAAMVDGEEGKELVFSVKDATDGEQSAQWGTARAIAANMVRGVTEGFSKTLEINGVGFRASVAGKGLTLSLGFSHDIQFPMPEGVAVTVEKNVITLTGIDAQAVGQTAARIRALKKPEPYLGKGIKYTGEQIRRKAGKAAKSAE